MDDLVKDCKPNSHKYKAEQSKKETSTEKKITPVVSGKVKTRKKSGARKLAGELISEEANNVGSYIVMDVLIPTIKKAIVEIVTDGINMIFFGGTAAKKRSSGSSYTPYSSIVHRDRGYDRHEGRYSRSSAYSSDEIILETRADCEEVIEGMMNIIDMYKVVSIADLNDLIGKTGEYTDNKYGWINVRNAEPIRVRDGWLLKLPKALPID